MYQTSGLLAKNSYFISHKWGKYLAREIGQDNTNPSLSSQTKRTLLWYVIKSIKPERKQFKPASQVLQLTKGFPMSGTHEMFVQGDRGEFCRLLSLPKKVKAHYFLFSLHTFYNKRENF